tara:strand:- start:12 stop:215 length:204 start_codon:yes stop_codon:yes gene_type:complete
MLELLTTELTAILKTVKLIEASEKTLPHEDKLRNLIGFLSNLETSVNGQIEMLQEELSNFTTDKSKN